MPVETPIKDPVKTDPVVIPTPAPVPRRTPDPDVLTPERLCPAQKERIVRTVEDT